MSLKEAETMLKEYQEITKDRTDFVPIRKELVTLPEYIEGKAKKTLVELSWMKDSYLDQRLNIGQTGHK